MDETRSELEGQSPEFPFVDDGEKPGVIPFGKSKFRPGDKVYLLTPDDTSREGPYVIASVPSPRVYTLSLENGEPVNAGREIEEKHLEKA